MLEIKNKLYNSKERKKQKIFNKYIETKKFFRLKVEKIFPLNENEKILYTDKYDFKEKSENIESNKYLSFNKRIHILTVIPKNELDNFYYSFCDLVKKNPSKNIFSKIILDERQKKSILNYSNKINLSGWSNLGYITPKSKELENIVDYFHIFIFNLSNDYIGLDFTAILNEKFNDDLNKFMISEIKPEINYFKYYVGNKKYINKSSPNRNISRKEKLDDILLEIKMRCYDFLNSYFNLFPLNNKAPITFDEYATNYEFNSENDYLLRCYDFYIFRDEQISKDMNIIITHHNKEFSQTFEKVNFIYECAYKNDYNRSARFLFNLPLENKDNFFEESTFMQIYKIILMFYYNIELENHVTQKRKLLNIALKNRKTKIYDQYLNINQTINTYNCILNNINIKNNFDEYENDEIKKSLKYQEERYNNIIKENNRLDTDFSNLLMAVSSKSSLSLSKISIWIAIISLIVTMIFSILSYTDSKKEKNESQPIIANELIINKDN